ncbi:MAG: tRNA (cytidine(34)-2'-O)-methyltransferase [Desulfovibrio sp.]|nr:tRNA (cytidine(34)-2'-O)-methyltransferase [Desulfovibrio sp.]
MEIVLFEPEIPPNTGNIARLCAAYGVVLNLVGKLGFSLEDKYLKRAGCDYWPHVKLRVWSAWDNFVADAGQRGRLIMTSTKGRQKLPDFEFLPGDFLVFGPETRGLPEDLLAHSQWTVRLPELAWDEGGVRSLNLSTTAGIFLYAALVSSGLMADFC